MKKNVRIILDSNGVIQAHALRTARRFFWGLMLRGKMTPATYGRLMRRVAHNSADPLTAEERKYIDQFYITGGPTRVPLLRGAKKTVMQLTWDYPGRVYVCSANAFSPESDARYRQWFMDLFPNLAGVHFVPAFSPKTEFYRQIRDQFPNDQVIVVDDAPRHIAEAAALGLTTRLIDKKNGYKSLRDAFYGRVK